MKFLLTSFLLISVETILAIGFNVSIADSLDQTTSHINGPNCWNAALFVSGVVEEKKFSSPEEWKYILKKHCREVETPGYGDIGRITDVNGIEVHGFIHINEEKVFAKHGENKRDGYSYMSYSEMLQFYGRIRRCRTSRDTQASCYNIIKYYKCDSKPSKNHYVQALGLLAQKLAFSSLTMYRHKDNCSSDSFLEREMIYEEMLKEMDLALGVKRFFNLADKLSLDSLRTQLYNTEVSNRYYRCKDRSRKSFLAKKVKARLKLLVNKD